MAPVPSWAGDCHSLGRFNNMRMRLASACECFYEPTATAGGVLVETSSGAAGESTRSVVDPTSAAESEIEVATCTEEMPVALGGETSTSSSEAAFTG